MSLLPIVYVAVATVSAGFSVWRWSQRRAAWYDVVRDAAHAVGLEDITESPPWLAGRLGPLTVRLNSKPGSYTRIEVTRTEKTGDGLSLVAENYATALKKSVGVREVEIGDPAFDRAVFIDGPTLLVRALLDAQTRAQFTRLLARSVQVELRDDVLSAVVRSAGGMAPKVRHREVLADLVRFGLRLVAPDDLPERVAENLCRETHAGVRLANLRALGREAFEHPATRAALRAAREDPDERVRLQAGIALDEAGREVLLELASDYRTSGFCAARAVAALGAALTVDDARPILKRAMHVGRIATAVACLEALSESARPGTERLALNALGSPDVDVRVTAARTLGRVGSVAAVQPLRDAEVRNPAGGLGPVARQAIAEIQSRLDAVPGQLSLAAQQAGQLSLSSEASGQLGLAGDADDAEHEPLGRSTEQ